MQLYHVSESCGFRENSELLVFSRLGEQKNLKDNYAVLLSTCRDFSPNLTSLTRLSQNRLLWRC